MTESSMAKELKTASAKTNAAIDEHIASATEEARSFVKQLQVHESLRAFAETGIEQSRETYAKMRDAAQDTAVALEKSTAKSTEIARDYNLKTIEFVAANFSAGFDHMRKLIQAQDASKALELQLDFVRKQTDALNNQSKELAELAVSAAKFAGEPLETLIAKSAS